MNKNRPVIRIVQGLLRGVIDESITGQRYAAFKGIPYGKPPIGKLRFRDPSPVESWSHVKDASKFGQNCAQYDPITRSLVGSDDCLYLNVYVPSDGTFQFSKKPVMFWIHGGYFAHGSGDDAIFGPDYIIGKDVVLVTINYRLNVLGFLNLENEEASGNQGLKDQVLALKWVRENIANFGGDPENVTIFGESAGGSAVHYLTMSSSAKGLFHKAISQSGVAINPWASTEESPKRHALKLAKMLGREIFDSESLLEFLRSVDARKLAEAEVQFFVESKLRGYRDFRPSIDAKSKNPFFTIPAGKAALAGLRIPFMLGYTSHEGIIFLTGISDKTLDKLDSDLEKALPPPITKMLNERGLEVSDFKKMYFGDKSVSGDTRDNYARMQGDVQFVAGIQEVASVQATKNESSTYMYKFSYDNGKSLVKFTLGLDMPGTCHADDLTYIFYPKLLKQLRLPSDETDSTDRLVIERMTELWTNFAKTGNPTPVVSSTLPVKWEALNDPEHLRCLNIGEDLRMEPVANVNKRWVKETTSKL